MILSCKDRSAKVKRRVTGRIRNNISDAVDGGGIFVWIAEYEAKKRAM